MVRLSVVIATKDRASYLDRALGSLEGQIGAPSFEIVVVDNGSTDDTKAVVERRAARVHTPIRYVYEREPNRGKARNRGLAIAQGDLVLFCDDDVQVPQGFIAAHEAAHRGPGPRVVNGPIINVPSYEDRPKPTIANYSRAFLCTCNASVPRSTLESVGGFDESFDLYGWEDSELGVRLREGGARWMFAWDAYIWHIKLPHENTLEVEARKAVEKARMAGKFLAKHPSKRARMATGAHGVNLWRGRYFLPDALLAFYAALAKDRRLPNWTQTLARAQLLDGLYTRELMRTLDE
jgi:glycosyltransferase involved in cell wall biosynthesis